MGGVCFQNRHRHLAGNKIDKSVMGGGTLINSEQNRSGKCQRESPTKAWMMARSLSLKVLKLSSKSSVALARRLSDATSVAGILEWSADCSLSSVSPPASCQGTWEVTDHGPKSWAPKIYLGDTGQGPELLALAWPSPGCCDIWEWSSKLKISLSLSFPVCVCV